jgi:hypothetical protein
MCRYRFTHRFDQEVSHHFSKLGRRVARNPCKTIAISLLVTFICASGLMFMVSETRGPYLWIPQESIAFESWKTIVDNFGGVRMENVLVIAKDLDKGALTKSAVDAVWELDASTRSVAYKGMNYSTLCYKPPSTRKCGGLPGPLAFWNSKVEYDTQVTTDADIVTALSAPSYADGTPVSRRKLFGSRFTTVDGSATGTLTSADGFMLGWLLAAEYGTDPDEDALAWELKWLAAVGIEGAPEGSADVVSPKQTRFDSIEVWPFAMRSVDDELARIVTLDMPLMMAAYMIMTVLACVVLSRGCNGWCSALCCGARGETRIALGCGGIGCVILSTLGGYGVCCALGVKFSQLQSILPFILVGIGVDGALVFCWCWSVFSCNESI